MYGFLTGPLLWLSILIFIGGMAYKIRWYLKGLDQNIDRVAYEAGREQGIKGALVSMFKWLIPFATYGWRRQIFATLAFFLFHAGLILVALFLSGHGVVMRDTIGFWLPSIPMSWADTLSFMALLGGVMLILRRITLPEVRILTDKHDWLIISLSMLVLITGLLTRFEVFGYNLWLLLHIFLGELVLILAPFTKLSHMVLYFLSRGQLGMDYAIKRGGSSRGSAFPW